MSIGAKIKDLRVKYGLTQEELASRTELSKGFISQLERDLASPSIATLMDILECLGTSLKDFFNEPDEGKIVYGPQDIFVKAHEELGITIEWLVTSAQKNSLEPILVTLNPGAKTEIYPPHAGEEYGYVLSGGVTIILGERRCKARKGDSFHYEAYAPHFLENNGKAKARVLWISTPPSF